MRILATIGIIAALAVIAYLYMFRGSDSAASMTEEQFAADHDLNGLFIDVRTANEFESGYLEGAINANVFDSDFQDQVDAYDRDRPVYLYCGSGQRSGRASAILAEMGFTQAYNIGGYNKLKQAGVPVVEPGQ